MPAPKGHEPYPGCETGGRPKKYTTEFIENEANELERWMEKKENIFLEDFAFERGYSYSRALEWTKINEKFACTYERFQMRQKVILFKGGLTKKFSYPMCALILSHSHSIVAKTEQKVSGDTVNPLSFILKDIDGQTKDLVDGEAR